MLHYIRVTDDGNPTLTLATEPVDDGGNAQESASGSTSRRRPPGESTEATTAGLGAEDLPDSGYETKAVGAPPESTDEHSSVADTSGRTPKRRTIRGMSAVGCEPDVIFAWPDGDC